MEEVALFRGKNKIDVSWWKLLYMSIKYRVKLCYEIKTYVVETRAQFFFYYFFQLSLDVYSDLFL